MHKSIQRSNCFGILIGLIRVGHTAAPQHIIDQQQSTGPQQRDHMLVIGLVVRLVRIDETEVERAFFSGITHGLERVDRRSDPKTDPITDPSLFPVFFAHCRPLLAHITAN